MSTSVEPDMWPQYRPHPVQVACVFPGCDQTGDRHVHSFWSVDPTCDDCTWIDIHSYTQAEPVLRQLDTPCLKHRAH